MLSIKLQRIGKKHQPSYRVVVAQARSKMAAPPVEDLGSFNPFSKAFSVKKDRVEYWMGKGAKPTVTAHNLLVKAGAIKAAKTPVKIKKPQAPVAVTAAAEPTA